MVSPIIVNADGWLVGFILAVACRIYPRLLSDPCTSPQLSKAVVSTVRSVVAHMWLAGGPSSFTQGRGVLMLVVFNLGFNS